MNTREEGLRLTMSKCRSSNDFINNKTIAMPPRVVIICIYLHWSVTSWAAALRSLLRLSSSVVCSVRCQDSGCCQLGFAIRLPCLTRSQVSVGWLFVVWGLVGAVLCYTVSPVSVSHCLCCRLRLWKHSKNRHVSLPV